MILRPVASSRRAAASTSNARSTPSSTTRRDSRTSPDPPAAIVQSSTPVAMRYASPLSRARLTSLDDRGPHRVPPLRPAPIVVAHLAVAQQVREHEPGVRRPLADPAVGDYIVALRQPLLGFVDPAQLRCRLKRPVGIGCPSPGHAACRRDVPAA